MLKNIKKIKKRVKVCFFILTHLRHLWFISKHFDVKHLTPFKIDDWHHGYAYFTGLIGDLRVFIKIDTKLMFLRNEVIAFELLKGLVRIPRIIAHYKKDSFEAIISEYIEANTLTLEDLISKPNLVSNILEIIRSINLRGVIHRDIKLKNFFIYQDNIWIFDFTFAISKSPVFGFKELDLTDKFQAKVLSSIGDGYNPGYLVWNDFLSLQKILSYDLLKYPVTSQSIRGSVDKYMDQIEVEHKSYTYSYERPN